MDNILDSPRWLRQCHKCGEFKDECICEIKDNKNVIDTESTSRSGEASEGEESKD